MAILHITFSLSARGSLKRAIRQNQLQREESVICVNDIFSVGPLTSVEERKTWLNTYILKDEDEQELFDDTYKEWENQLHDIPCDLDVWIWYGQNAHEQIGLRFVMSQFGDKCSMLFGIDTTKGLKRMEQTTSIRQTGEISAEYLMKLRADAKRFSIEDCNKLAKEWTVLKQHTGTLRIWQEGLVHVEENALDAMILASAKRVQEEQGEEWLVPTRVISEVASYLPDYVGDAFIEKRIFELEQQGYFEIVGDRMDVYSYQLKYQEP